MGRCKVQQMEPSVNRTDDDRKRFNATYSGGGMRVTSTSRNQGESRASCAVHRLLGSNSSMWSIRSRPILGMLKKNVNCLYRTGKHAENM